MSTATPLTKEQSALAGRWIPLARKIVAKHATSATEFTEMFSAAQWALCKAARSYDAAKGYTFQALATRAITNACIDEHRRRKHCHVELKEHHVGSLEPAKPWTPPSAPEERRIRPPGMSARSIRRRAKEQGWERPRGRPPALDTQALARALACGKYQSVRELAAALGLHRRTLSRGKNGQLLRRLSSALGVRIFGNAKQGTPRPRTP